jgi:hypothetical protein
MMKWHGKARTAWMALAAVVLAGVLVWLGQRLLGGPTGQEAARLAAAEFLGVEEDNVTLRHTRSADRGYQFDLTQDGSGRTTLWVNPDPVYVRAGVFYHDIHEEGKRRLSEADAVAAAREFATEHFGDFGKLGKPSSVKAISAGALPAWGVAWESYDDGPLRWSLAIAVDAVRGEVLNFQTRKEQARGGPRLRAKVTREEALRIARARRPEGWEVHRIESRMVRTWRERPLGYPVWEVTVHCRQPIEVEKSVDGREAVGEPRYAGMVTSYLIDAVTGEVCPPVSPRRSPARPSRAANAPISREEAVKIASESIEKGLQESSQEGWVRTKVVSAELDKSGMWRAADYPVWDVRLQYESPGEDETGQARVHGRFIDGITGEVVAYPESRIAHPGPEPD